MASSIALFWTYQKYLRCKYTASFYDIIMETCSTVTWGIILIGPKIELAIILLQNPCLQLNTGWAMRFAYLGMQRPTIELTMVAYGSRQNAIKFTRANNSDLLQAQKHLIENQALSTRHSTHVWFQATHSLNLTLFGSVQRTQTRFHIYI